MDLYLKQTIQAFVVKAVVLCIVGVSLFFVDQALWSRDVALVQVPCILVISTLFFAVSLLGQMFYLPIMRRGGKGVLGYYLLAKVVRLFIAIVLLVGYALLHREYLLPFALNIVVLYMVEMISSIVHSTRMERNSKNQQ